MYSARIITNRTILRPLDVNDVSERYLGWLRDKASLQYISAAALQPDITALRQYVLERSGREDVVFLGIFEKDTGLHIGNLKYEPVNTNLGYAIMGILIGESDWRGKGIAAEVLAASANLLFKRSDIKQIILGVSRSNTSAIRAYQKIGFIEKLSEYIPNVSAENMTMIWDIGETSS